MSTHQSIARTALTSWQLWIFAFWFLFGLAVLSADVPPPAPVCGVTETVCETGELR